MGKILNEKRYPCRIATSGVLYQLGCITGPVPFCLLTNKQIEELVMAGIQVFEKNPGNLSDEVRLVPVNMLDHPFEQKETAEEETVEENTSSEESSNDRPDLSKMTKKQKKEYYRNLAKQNQEEKPATEISVPEMDPVLPDA